MGAGTPENGIWPGDATPDLRSGNQSMNATTHTGENSTGTTRGIDDDRIHRALTEDLSIAVVAPAQYAVTHDDRRYDVDLGTATCDCPDATYRDVACKHLLAAATFHGYLSEPNTRFVARVLRAVGEHGCAHDVRGCAGPVALGDRGIPCQSCIESVTPGVWTVWNRLVASRVVAPDDLPTAETALVADLHERDVESAVVTDGGRDTERIYVAECEDCGWRSVHDDPTHRDMALNGHETVERADEPTWHTVERSFEDVPTDGGERQ